MPDWERFGQPEPDFEYDQRFVDIDYDIANILPVRSARKGCLSAPGVTCAQ